MQKIGMVIALFRLSQLSDRRGDTMIEDEYCCVCTIDSKIRTICDPRNTLVDEPKEYIVGVGGIYLNTPNAPGGVTPIYRVI